jgi:hypothetical protein
MGEPSRVGGIPHQRKGGFGHVCYTELFELALGEIDAASPPPEADVRSRLTTIDGRLLNAG